MKHPLLSDEVWEQLCDLIPPQKPTGRRRRNDRSVLGGILYQREHKCRWRDIPRAYGPHITIWRRADDWSKDGLLERILARIREVQP